MSNRCWFVLSSVKLLLYTFFTREFTVCDERCRPQVLPMNDEPPQLGGGLRGELSCKEGGRVQVTVDYLSATDQDSDDSRLTYMLARSPGRGELQRAGLTVDKFSQQDLLQGHVYYVHTGEKCCFLAQQN